MEENSTTADQQTPAQTQTGPKKKLVALKAFIAVMVLVIAAQGYVVVKLNKSNNDEKTQRVALAAQLQSIKQQNTELQKQIKDSTADDTDSAVATLSIGFKPEAQHFWAYAPDPSESQPDFLLVNMSMKNDTKKPLAFSRAELKLKDKNNTAYPLALKSSYASEPRFQGGIPGLPNGASELADQTLQPGETTTGILVFAVPQKTNDFTISYGNTTAQITAKAR